MIRRTIAAGGKRDDPDRDRTVRLIAIIGELPRPRIALPEAAPHDENHMGFRLNWVVCIRIQTPISASWADNITPTTPSHGGHAHSFPQISIFILRILRCFSPGSNGLPN